MTVNLISDIEVYGTGLRRTQHNIHCVTRLNGDRYPFRSRTPFGVDFELPITFWQSPSKGTIVVEIITNISLPF